MSGNVAYLPPLWWMARRSVRLLTCLAIAVLALSSWSGQQPAGTAAVDSTPYATVLPMSADVRHSPAVRPGQPTYVPTATAASATKAAISDPSVSGSAATDPTAPAGDSVIGRQPAEADQGLPGSAEAATVSGTAARPAGPRAPPHRLA
jgi:hypothetical protein